MSDILRKIGDTITETGKSVGEKTKQVGNTAKLNAKIISSEHSISENYALIGKYYYDNYKNDPDEEIAEKVNAVTAAIDSIAEMKAQILMIKGLVKCQNCGAECPNDDDYCGKCGTKLVKPEPPVEEISEEADYTEEAADAEETSAADTDAEE